MGKLLKPLPEIDPEKCASCGVCIDSCPVDCLAFALFPQQPPCRRRPHLGQPDRCIGCGECARTCPLDAIQMAQRQRRA